MRFAFISIWLSLAIGAIAAMFHINFEVEKLELRLHQVNRQIAREEEAAHVLEAEWSYLNRPQRLKELSSELLPNLVPMSSSRYMTIARLEMRPRVKKAQEIPALATAWYSPVVSPPWEEHSNE